MSETGRDRGFYLGAFSFPAAGVVAKHIPLLLALLTVLAMGWSSLILVRQPYSGLSWSYSTGLVKTVAPGGPADGIFQVGDLIRTVDGVGVYQARELPGRRAGDNVLFTVERSGTLLEIPLRLSAPSTLQILYRLTVIAIAFPFWLVSLLVLALGRSSRIEILFFLVCNLFVLIIGLGSVSATGPLFMGLAFNFLMWWVGPLIVQTHLLLVNPAGSARRTRLLKLAYGLALIFSLADLGRLHLAVLGPLSLVKSVWIGGMLIISAWILAAAGRLAPSSESLRQTRLVAFAALLAFLPVVLLSLIPNSLTGQYILPFEISLLALPVLPMGYGYAILRYRLIHLEQYVNRTAAYSMVVVFIASIYGVIAIITGRLPQGHWMTNLGWLTTASLIGLSLPLYRALQKFVDHIFYGAWYDDRATIKQISSALNQVEADVYSVSTTLCQTLQKTMQLEYVNMLLADGRLASTEPVTHPSFPWGEQRVAELCCRISSHANQKFGRAAGLLEQFRSYERELGTVLGKKPMLWLVLGGQENYKGLVILGVRKGGGDLSSKDLEILEVVIRQTEAALENAYLLEEVQQHTEKIKMLHRQLILAREEERKRVARDLHDKTIQAMVGLNYQMANVRAEMSGENAEKLVPLQSQLRAALNDLRQVCADLRPPALDSLGLIPAIHSRISEFEEQVSRRITFESEGVDEEDLPEEISLCLYRFLQEALVNIQKHSQATEVHIQLQHTGDSILFKVQDNGVGFTLPPRLSAMIQERHFGLVGLQEQVEAVQGKLIIETAPGAGCLLAAEIPVERMSK